MHFEKKRHEPFVLTEKYPALLCSHDISERDLTPKAVSRIQLHQLGFCSLPTAVVVANQASSDALIHGNLKRSLDALLELHCAELGEHPGVILRVASGGMNRKQTSLPWLPVADITDSKQQNMIDTFILDQKDKLVLVHLEHVELQKNALHVRILFGSDHYSVQTKRSVHARKLESDVDQLYTTHFAHLYQYFTSILPIRSQLCDRFWLEHFMTTLEQQFPGKEVCEIRVYPNGSTHVMAVE